MKRELYKVEGEKVIRMRRNCPKCGDGVFLAEHKDRLSCGKCGYTEFKGKKEKKPEPPAETPPKEEKGEPKEKKPETPIESDKSKEESK